MSKISGRCLCGKVSYEIDGEPLSTGFCHCRSCQKETGAQALPFLFLPKEAVTITGETKSYSQAGSSGQHLHRHFCPNCGSCIFGHLDVAPTMMTIVAGTLDDPSHFKPQVNIWTSEAQAWDTLHPGLTNFEQNPG